MKTMLPFFLGILLSVQALAVGPTVSPTTTAVTVYRNGAKLTSVASVKVPAGKTDVVLENISPYFNSNSLQVKIAGNATLHSAAFRYKTPGPAPENPRVRIIKDSLLILSDVEGMRNSEIALLGEKADLIRKNQSQVGAIDDKNNRRLSLAELRELADYYTAEIGRIQQQQMELRLGIRKIDKHQQRLQSELASIQPYSPGQSGEIVLRLNAENAQTLEITCSYIVSGASWSPLYDLRSDGLNEPIQLAYKANVRNQTGYDWKNVTLQLSTAQPLTNNNRPILQPVYVDFKTVEYRQEQFDAKLQVNSYQMNQVASPAAGYEATFTPPPAPEDVNSFDIAQKQDIPSDDKEYLLTIQENKIEAAYEYHTVPKIDPGVFLLAKIANYGQYNLLPGTANIFFEDTYIGQTNINPATTADTLLLSLGRDEQITVKRVQPQDFKERRKILNAKIRENYAYEITVKNNKAKAITVTILDQIPISKNETIKVELGNIGSGQYNEKFGKLEWEITIPSGQSKKVQFEYSVEYPKDKNIGLKN